MDSASVLAKSTSSHQTSGKIFLTSTHLVSPLEAVFSTHRGLIVSVELKAPIFTSTRSRASKCLLTASGETAQLTQEFQKSIKWRVCLTKEKYWYLEELQLAQVTHFDSPKKESLSRTALQIQEYLTSCVKGAQSAGEGS